MSKYEPLDWSIAQLCRCLEWGHSAAFRARCRDLESVELGVEERNTLNQLASLHKFGERVSIESCMLRFQEWFNIFLDGVQVADAYIDHELFHSKSHWIIWSSFEEATRGDGEK